MDERTHAWLKKQRDDLINMSRTNRLLYFKHTKVASLEVAQPGPASILGKLSQSTTGGHWSFYLPPDQTTDEPYARSPSPGELVIADKDAKQIGNGGRGTSERWTALSVDHGLTC